ncbi:MAG: type fimbrial biosis protein FimT [Pseudomonadota bacterium]|nr:type fimbrial biosis protein FimT [Pseudomonadota bacterium]
MFRSSLHTQRSSLNKASRGMTAIELLAALSIVAILSAMAVPAFRDFMQNNRAAEQSNALVGALALARNEAVTRGVPVSVCVSTDGESCDAAGGLFTFWTPGWIVFTDAAGNPGDVDDAADPPDTVLRVMPALSGEATLASNRNFVSYTPSGFLSGAQASFMLSVPDCTGNQNRMIVVNPQGRATLTHTPCVVPDP